MANEAGIGIDRPAPRTAGRKSRAKFRAALAACLVGIAILFALGTWQVERLHWKEGLIARIDARMHGAPLDLSTLRQRFSETGDVDYLPVALHGRFLNAGERYFLSTFDGEAGWNVYTPLVTDEGAVVLVNRGFVPYALRDPAKRREGQVKGEVAVTGIARNAPAEKPGYFVPDNDPAKNEFFWRDITAMSAGLALGDDRQILPFFVDAGPGRAPGGWPEGGTTALEIPNNHLQYVFTWYGIGAVLLVMTVLLIVRDRRARSA